MKTLENYGVKSLNTQEIIETDGGTLATGYGGWWNARGAVHAITDFVSGALDRFNEYRN